MGEGAESETELSQQRAVCQNLQRQEQQLPTRVQTSGDRADNPFTTARCVLESSWTRPTASLCARKLRPRSRACSLSCEQEAVR